jgi:tRNA A-37 threonylcarbamoyl transferase component Bud32
MAMPFAHPPGAGDDQEGLLEQACAELERRLRAGQECHAEDILSIYPSLNGDPQYLLELVLAELDIRRDLGQLLKPEEWYSRYPHWQERLWLWFQVESQATGPGGDTLPLAPPAPTDEIPVFTPGTIFGRFRLLEELGRGGMGIVYRAEDLTLGRQVALKRIRAGALAERSERARFAREARAAARLRHPHIMTVYEVGQVGEEPFLALELLPGGSLATRRAQWQGQPRQVAALLEKVARAVHHAHSQGILHRDLKPSNILLDEAGEPRVADFGLAKFLQGDAELTQSGLLVGTPAYLAPEILRGGASKASPQSDIWALGVILYELLTGQRPFNGVESLQVMEQILHAEPPPLRIGGRGRNRELESICLKCLEKDPARRYATAADLAEDLARWLRGEPIRARPPAWPRRLGHWLRRHRRLRTALALLPLAALGASLLLPSEPAFRQAERRLRAGRAVTLIDQLGPPRWSEWVFTDSACSQSLEATQVFTLASDVNHLELLPQVPCPAFRYRAEIQQVVGPTPALSLVGIYFGHQAWPTDQGTEHCLVNLKFSETMQVPPDKNGQERRIVSLAVQRKRCGPKTLIDKHISLWSHYYTPQPRHFLEGGYIEDFPWRQLAVEVTPTQVRIFWEGQQMGCVTTAELRRQLYRLLTDPQHPLTVDPPADLLGGGLGLVIIRSQARVRSVVVEPLNEAAH